ncbi:GyrI-like domain-containing protein [Risungbinella massiliensis]|uniref:GyrI-like domain-containing protein n=1 Tax=Risungbinella massiliensis TaxID=1329796 RepID=UPI001E2DFFAB|nr:GyrI-like domain-containing protein [Risungbinella massiliensis]
MMSISITESRVILLHSFTLIGTSKTTSNTAEMSGNGIIAKQWENFYQNNIHAQILNKKDTSILALYTDYESDETGSYTYALGAQVEDTVDVPEGMEKIIIPPAKYVVFTTSKGPLQEVSVEAWKYIWEWSKQNERAFLADFEVYDERASDPQNAQVDIYISIK